MGEIAAPTPEQKAIMEVVFEDRRAIAIHELEILLAKDTVRWIEELIAAMTGLAVLAQEELLGD